MATLMRKALCLGVLAGVLAMATADGSAKMEKYYKRTGSKWLNEKAKEDGVFRLPSGMLFKVLKEGSGKGKSPGPNDQSDVTYAGQLKTGEQFDAGTTKFAPNQVIAGWTEAMQLMCEGEQWEVYIPYDQAYGARGSPPKIPAFSPLQFQMEINQVMSGGRPCSEAKADLKKKLEEAKAANDKEL